MPTFPTDPRRTSPYANHRFQVRWTDGDYVLGCGKVSGLARQTEMISYREGGDPAAVHVSPGQTDWVPVTLERGVTRDAGFGQWANKVRDYMNAPNAAPISLADFRRDLTIELCNEAGQKVTAYHLRNAWPSEFTALPELDANDNGLAVASLTLQIEGWTREDYDEPDEPSFLLPSS
jgi:phage tail-like protein